MRLSRFAVLFCILSMNIKIAKADPLDIKVVPYLSQLQRNLLAKDFEAAGNNKDKIHWPYLPREYGSRFTRIQCLPMSAREMYWKGAST